MHGSIRDRLEDLLNADLTVSRDMSCMRDLLDHLSSCNECATEFQAMKRQADLLRSLAVEEEVEPAVGFYGRVLQIIEERTKDSIWTVFDSPLGKQIMFASLALAMLLCTYVVAQESRDGHLGGNPIVAQDVNADPDEPVIGTTSQQRDAVLVNFASYQGSPQDAQP